MRIEDRGSKIEDGRARWKRTRSSIFDPQKIPLSPSPPFPLSVSMAYFHLKTPLDLSMSPSKSTYRASSCVVILAVLLAGCSPSQEATQPENPQVLIQTSLGAITTKRKP